MKYFSVTKVLEPFIDFSMIPPDVLNHAAARGTRVHNICLNVYAAGVPVLMVPEEVKPYFESFRAWFDDYVSKTIWIEEEFIDDAFGIVGHVDLVCILIDGRVVVVDLKTPVTEGPTWKAQLSAYRYLVNKQTDIEIPEKNGCMSLKLKPNGRPAKAIPYQYSGDDFAAFMSALNAYRYFK